MFAGRTLAAGFTSVRDLGTLRRLLSGRLSERTVGSNDYIGVGLRKMIEEVRVKRICVWHMLCGRTWRAGAWKRCIDQSSLGIEDNLACRMWWRVLTLSPLAK